MRSVTNTYKQVIERVFFDNYSEGAREVTFTRQQLIDAARAMNIRIPSNIGDVPYKYRYRSDLPDTVVAKAPAGEDWIILPAGRSLYQFFATTYSLVTPTAGMVETKVPEATPGIIAMHAKSDEQALLAKLRYNRLIDTFTGVTCYSLQNHFRTTVTFRGPVQVETDEIYVGVDKRGAQYVFPVQAKGGTDRLSVVQVIQDFAVGAQKFPNLICRPIAAQFLTDGVIALFDFEETGTGVALAHERHFRLVPPTDLSAEDLERYRNRPHEEDW